MQGVSNKYVVVDEIVFFFLLHENLTPLSSGSIFSCSTQIGVVILHCSLH